jgi:hypothetical protein
MELVFQMARSFVSTDKLLHISLSVRELTLSEELAYQFVRWLQFCFFLSVRELTPTARDSQQEHISPS